jgi:hypothetical protein
MILSKKCAKCQGVFDVSCFYKKKAAKDGLQSICKVCTATKNKEWKEAHPDYHDDWVAENMPKWDGYQKKSREKNRDARNAYTRTWFKDHPTYQKEWIKKNPDKVSLRRKLWKSLNKEKVKKWLRAWKDANPDYEKNRRKEDVEFKLLGNYRCRVYSAVLGIGKEETTRALIGCSTKEWLFWLESLFYGDMTVDNYGKVWNVDHVVPLKSFDLSDPEQVKKAFHYTNTQPLTVADNLAKSSKIGWTRQDA